MVAVCWFIVSASRACRSRMSPRRWGSRASAPTVGSPGSTPKATPGCSTVPRGRIACRRGPRPRSKRRCSRPGVEHRRGQDWLGPELGVPARTVQPDPAPPRACRGCAVCDPMTGEVIRASKTTAVRYERDRPGELVHMDVKKIGRIPDGGGWRAHGRQMGSQLGPQKATDRLRLRPLRRRRPQPPRLLRDPPRRAGPRPAPAFFARALEHFAGHGIHRSTRS